MSRSKHNSFWPYQWFQILQGFRLKFFWFLRHPNRLHVFSVYVYVDYISWVWNAHEHANITNRLLSPDVSKKHLSLEKTPYFSLSVNAKKLLTTHFTPLQLYFSTYQQTTWPLTKLSFWVHKSTYFDGVFRVGRHEIKCNLHLQWG